MNICLKDLCRFVNGGTPPKSIPEFFSGAIPWVSGADILPDRSIRPRVYITEEAISKSSTNLVPKNTLILVTRTTVGKVAISQYELCFSQDITAVLPDERLDTKYLMYFLSKSKEEINSHVRGATIKGVPRRVIENLKIPLPDLKTQKRIVAVLEQADRLRAACRQAREQLNQLAQSVFLEMFGDPTRNPHGYKPCLLSEYIDKIETGKNLMEASAPSHEAYRVLKVSSVSWGKFQPNESKTLPLDYNPPLHHLVKQGDLLVTRANTSVLVGASTIVEEGHNKLLLPDKIWRLILKESFIDYSHWFQQLISTSSVRKQIRELATGTSGSMKNISMRKFLSIKTFSPPPEAILSFEKIMLLHLKVMPKLDSQLFFIENTFDALLQKAFKGELEFNDAAFQQLEQVAHV